MKKGPSCAAVKAGHLPSVVENLRLSTGTFYIEASYVYFVAGSFNLATGTTETLV